MLGLVTIGQSPREDIVASMLPDIDPDRVLQAGALDELDESSIECLVPVHHERPLVTRLRDGREVVVAKERIVPLLREAVRRVDDAGANTICVMCTGAFPRFHANALVAYPDQILSRLIDAVLPSGVLGVVMPHAGQQVDMLDKWTTPGRVVITGVASPYSSGIAVTAVVRQIVDAGAELVVLDCMGFDRRMARDARMAVDAPVVLANGLVGSVLCELSGVSARFLSEV